MQLIIQLWLLLSRPYYVATVRREKGKGEFWLRTADKSKTYKIVNAAGRPLKAREWQTITFNSYTGDAVRIADLKHAMELAGTKWIKVLSSPGAGNIVLEFSLQGDKVYLGGNAMNNESTVPAREITIAIKS